MTNIFQEVIQNFSLKNLTNFLPPFLRLFAKPSMLTKIYQNSDKKITKNPAREGGYFKKNGMDVSA